MVVTNGVLDAASRTGPAPGTAASAARAILPAGSAVEEGLKVVQVAVGTPVNVTELDGSCGSSSAVPELEVSDITHGGDRNSKLVDMCGGLAGLNIC
jgi:hypothetical protein